jgi:fluoride exporter
MRLALLVALASAAGGLLRYGAALAATRLLGPAFPWGTLFVNALGCLLIGFVNQLGVESRVLPEAVRLPIAVGLLGGFTTFSSFGYESFRLLEAGRWAAALANVVGSVLAGLLLVWLGTKLGRQLMAAAG